LGGLVSSHRPSGFRVRYVAPSVMLVRVEDESPLCLDDLGVHVYRVRHPIPAIQRAGVLKPHVLVIGPTVRPIDAASLWSVAEQNGGELLELSRGVDRDHLGRWLRAMVLHAAARRSRSEEVFESVSERVTSPDLLAATG